MIAPDPPSSPRPRWLLRRIPALDALRRYSLPDARADLVAGMTVAALAVPQAMAYAMAAGLPAQHGLYTAIVMTAAGALFDSSKHLVNGPTNAISIAVLSALALSPPSDRVAAAILLAFWVGAAQVGIALLRLGDLTRYISHSVIVGFTLGAAALLSFAQVEPLLGLAARGVAHEHAVVRLYRAVAEGSVHPATLAVGMGSLAAALLLGRLKRRRGWELIPDLLLVVAGAAIVTRTLGLDRAGVAVVGPIPASLPRLALPRFDAFASGGLPTAALSIALLGVLEALSMAKMLAAKTGQKVDMNQQCLSEGLANLTGSFFQCFPGSGSLTRSVVNHQAGGRTQWSGLASAVAVAVVVATLAAETRYIPRATLSAILVLSAARMIDLRAVAYHVRATYFDAAIVVVTAVSAVAVSIEICVLAGVFLSFALTVPRAGRMRLSEFVVSPEGAVIERLPSDAPCPKILIFGLEGELFFGASAALEEHFEEIGRRIGGETRVLLLRMKRAHNPDAVALDLLERFLARMKARGVHVLLCGVRKHLYDVLVRTGAASRLDERIFLEERVRQTSTLKALEHAHALVDAPCAACPRRRAADMVITAER